MEEKMSSLLSISSDRMNALAEKAYNMQFELDKDISSSYTERQRRSMYEDILYNLSYLDIALRFDDVKIFTEYTKWLYQLLCHLSKDNLDSNERTHYRLKEHYQILSKIFQDSSSEEELIRINKFIEEGIKTLDTERFLPRSSLKVNSDKY